MALGTREVAGQDDGDGAVQGGALYFLENSRW